MPLRVTGFTFIPAGGAPVRVPRHALSATLQRRIDTFGREAQQRFLRAWYRHVDALLQGRGTRELRAMLPVRTGRLRRSLRLYLRGNEIRIAGEFYLLLNASARRAVIEYSRTGLQQLVTDAAAMAVNSL